jgi:hypothetical protein
MAQTRCEETFPTRLEEAKANVKTWVKENDAHQKYLQTPRGKALAFFNQHCRFLNKLEIAIRKLDDQWSFVCDANAGPKPKLLTTRLVAEHGTDILTNTEKTDWRNAECSDKDPIDLAVSSDFDDKENGARAYLVLCYEDPRPACQKLMESLRTLLSLLAQQKAEGNR